jgi:hypothetical protein
VGQTRRHQIDKITHNEDVILAEKTDAFGVEIESDSNEVEHIDAVFKAFNMEHKPLVYLKDLVL